MKRLALLLSLMMAWPLVAQVTPEPLPESGVRLGGRGPTGGAPVAVCIDFAQPAWLLMYGVPPADAALPCANRAMTRVRIDEFNRPAMRARLKGWLKHEIAPELDVVGRVMQLARQQPRVPVGLTFEGGMAITNTDYRDTETRYAAWRADPSGYARSQWSQR